MSYASGTCGIVKSNVARVWRERGGRSLDVAPPRLTKNFRQATSEREKTRRPNQGGSVFMGWKEAQFNEVAPLETN